MGAVVDDELIVDLTFEGEGLWDVFDAKKSVKYALISDMPDVVATLDDRGAEHLKFSDSRRLWKHVERAFLQHEAPMKSNLRRKCLGFCDGTRHGAV